AAGGSPAPGPDPGHHRRVSRSRRGRGPRRHRLRRPARLVSAQAWITSGARVTTRAYARRYGVDRYTAHSELTALGVTLPGADARWAVRPAPVPRPRPRRPAPHPPPAGLSPARARLAL